VDRPQHRSADSRSVTRSQQIDTGLCSEHARSMARRGGVNPTVATFHGLVLVLVALSLVLVGCGGGGETTTEQTQPTYDQFVQRVKRDPHPSRA
jgi:hypothetical protein